MTRRNLGVRLARLEALTPAVVDLAGEARRYGTPLWQAGGWRAYGAQPGTDALLTLVGVGALLTYQVVNVCLGDLS